MTEQPLAGQDRDHLHEWLKQYWGYDTFRPRQERIVRSLLAGRDVAVVMPTGGGKSLCYQLPALISGRTAIVVSPLLSLMRDQTAQLAQMGIPAAAINSNLTASEQSQVIRDACRGEYRLLYLSPERLARPDTVTWLQRVDPVFFVIDEAHCISEWGHEFRPDYRQLKRLRELFPAIPIAAFTASATRRVRQDILDQLQLRDPDKHILSFHRPNLRYLAHECDSRQQEYLLLRAMQEYSGTGNMIVYAPTIDSVHTTTALLKSRGIEAVPYHGKMEASERERNQELWMNDEVPVLVGTLAFGLGVNKPSTRAVIHLALPKSIEQYYQEAGRAGRDGQPADCLLLWRKRDFGLLAHFNEQIEDEDERARAWQRYHSMRRFVEEPLCRHRQICLHFGETPKWEECDACDVCGAEPDWMSSRPHTREPGHSPKPRRSVEPPRRRMVATSDEVPVIEADQAPIDKSLYEELRRWRWDIAHRLHVPAFIVLHDSTMEDLSRRAPTTYDDLMQVSGIGQRKAQLYGSELLEVIERYRKG